MNLSACIEWLFAPEYPDIVDRIHASRDAGLAGVELHLWRDKPLERIARAIEQTGLALNAIVVDPRCRLADAASLPAFRQAVRETLAAARQMGARHIIPSVGPALPDVDRAVQRAHIIAALREAAELASGTGVGVLIEPINSRVDHPGMYLTSTAEGLTILRELDVPNVHLLYDCYHAATMGEPPDEALRHAPQWLGYVQVADSPGRHEPGTGQIDWGAYRRWIADVGYQGPIGLEYKPLEGTLAALERTRRALAG